MDEEINKYLTEAMGECWHEWSINHWEAVCDICNDTARGPNSGNNNDFSTWEGFGKLWEWATKKEWWVSFCASDYMACDPFMVRLDKLINPTNFTNAIYTFLKEK